MIALATPFQSLVLFSQVLIFLLSDLACFVSFDICSIVHQMADEKKVVDPALTGFYEAMEKTNIEKITNEMLADLSEDSDDSGSFDTAKMLKIRPGDQVAPSSENHPLSRVKLTL
jgi:hypothetical protein